MARGERKPDWLAMQAVCCEPRLRLLTGKIQGKARNAALQHAIERPATMYCARVCLRQRLTRVFIEQGINRA